MGSQLMIRAACGTHPGQIRENNQDSVLAFVRGRELGVALGLFVVADGMGGHKAGEIASQLAVDTIRDNLAWMLEQDDAGATILSPSSNSSSKESNLASSMETRLKQAVLSANDVIYEYALEHPAEAGNLGCTVTCAMVYGNTAVIANVGDSRAYRWRKGELVQITDDHSYVWQLVSEGFIDEGEIYDHPQRNVITRALGNQPSVQVDMRSCKLESGDRLLLCSDGVWEMIRDPAEMAAMLEAELLEKVVGQLIEAANKYGGYDNIGVVVAELTSLS